MKRAIFRIVFALAFVLEIGCDRASSTSPSTVASTPIASVSALDSASVSPSISPSVAASIALDEALDRTERELIAASAASASGSTSATKLDEPSVVPAPSSRVTPPPWLLAMTFDPPRPDAENDLRPVRWKLKTCWRRLATDAATTGSTSTPIAIDLVLDEAGAVVKAAIAKDGGDRALSMCLLSTLKSSTFTQSDGSSPKLRVTWTPKP